MLAQPADAAAQTLSTDLVRASRLLEAWDVEEAERIVERARASAPTDPDVRFLRARVLFHRGRHEEALSEVRSAIEGRRTREDWKAFRDLVDASLQTTRGFSETTTPDGRFSIRTSPADAVLVPYIAQTLAAAAREVGRDLGLVPRGPIVVEVLPDADSLARISTLTTSEIRTSGTIALCKWNRIMLTSPRALVRGYPFRDTLCHEYTHLVISRATSGAAPIWLHEGLAKLEEQRWTGRPAPPLDAAHSHLLERAAHSAALIPFERLHPSIARLPSQAQAALAFAQVWSLLRVVLRRAGYEGLRDALAQIRAGHDAEVAVARAAHTSWFRLIETWRAEARARRSAPDAVARVLELRFREGEADPDDTSEIETGRAQRSVRLGDLLWERQRRLAASTEYQRAARFSAEDPVVANRAARAALEMGRPEEVPRLLERSLALYQDFPQSHLHLGLSLLASGDSHGATTEFERALDLNPFDPEVHCSLAELYAQAGDQARADRERQACTSLR